MRVPSTGWQVNWRCRCARLDRKGVAELTARRDALVERCLARGARLYEGNFAKLYTGKLSPGCLTCARGEWSYLEVSQLCQKRCFYCPRPQTRLGRPFERMLGLPFDFPGAYARAVRELGFRGVGLSGGEPLLAMDRTVRLLRSLRRSGGKGLYLWAYTNGALADGARLKRLRDAGLDELRFDLSACDYDLSAVRRAVRLIPAVAVEIPAIPEDLERVKALLGELAAGGVRYLNLHQLTGTPFNDENFRRRGYTVVDNGPMISPSVVESELAALSLIDYSLEKGIGLPINYCSFVYKRRFHARIRRSRLAGRLMTGGRLETVTEPGWVRGIMVKGDRAPLAALARRLPSGKSRLVDVEGESRLLVAPETLESPALRGREIAAAYSEYEQELPGRGAPGSPSLGLGRGKLVRYRRTRQAEILLRGRRELALFARALGPVRLRRFAGLEFMDASRHSYRGAD